MAELDDELYGATQTAPTVTEMRSIADLVQTVSDLESEIETGEALVARLKEARLGILQKELVDAMAAAGTASFVTANGGLEVTVKTQCSGSLAKEDEAKRTAQINYVADHGGSGIITADVILRFGRANRDAAHKVAEAFKDRDDCVIEVKEGIHPQTLGAWGRELLEKGIAFEPEKAGLWTGKIAVIKPPKELKTKPKP
jgi:hypothetical protein